MNRVTLMVVLILLAASLPLGYYLHVTGHPVLMFLIMALWWAASIGAYFGVRRSSKDLWNYRSKYYMSRSVDDLETIYKVLGWAGLAYERQGLVEPSPYFSLVEVLYFPSEHLRIFIRDIGSALQVYLGPVDDYNAVSVKMLEDLVDEAFG